MKHLVVTNLYHYDTGPHSSTKSHVWPEQHSSHMFLNRSTLINNYCVLYNQLWHKPRSVPTEGSILLLSIYIPTCRIRKVNPLGALYMYTVHCLCTVNCVHNPQTSEWKKITNQWLTVKTVYVSIHFPHRVTFPSEVITKDEGSH